MSDDVERENGIDVKRHLADLRARSGLITEQLMYAGRLVTGSSFRRWSPVEA